MPDGGEIITENFESSIENLNIEHWENVQMTNTLRLLNGENQLSFYRIEGDKVVYDMETVKKYLTHICKKEDGTLKTWEEMTDDIWVENLKAENGGGSTIAWTTAVQIALEYLGYDVGKIDGNKGGNTEKAIKKYQRNNNLEIDGQPGPEVIHCLINDVEEFIQSKKKLKYIETKIGKNGNSMGITNAFKLHDDGSFELTNEMKEFMIDRFVDSYRGMPDTNREKYLSNLKNPFNEILEGLLKDGESRVIEFDINNTKKRQCFGNKGNGAVQIFSMFLNLLLDGDNPLMDINMRIIPNFVMGIDGSYITNNENNIFLEQLRNMGITMESSRLFLDECIKNGNANNYKEIDFYSFLDDKTIKFLFGDDINKYEEILPLTVMDGLILYKLKTTRGDLNFKSGIYNMINSGVLNIFTKSDLYNLVISNLTYQDLPEYIRLSKYLSSEKKHILPCLEGYSPKKYLQIVKFMRKYGIDYDLYSKHIKSCEILLKNNVPGDALLFIGTPKTSNMKELFDNKYGRELYLFLKKYPQKLKNLGGKEIREIGLTTEAGGYNFCFRGILEMMKSRTDLKAPILGENPTEIEKKNWKTNREKIIKEYENILRNYISMDKDENGNLKPKNRTFDKVFYANALDHKHDDWNRSMQGVKMDFVLKGFCRKFEDCSNIIDEKGDIDETNQKTMIKKIEQYSELHQNEKILVYIGTHGNGNGSSSNSWKKEDWLKLANISKNVKVMSSRCYFGGAYTSNPEDLNYIYGLNSSVSGFSNNTSSNISAMEVFREGYEKKGLGFHELEIYTRLHYDYSFSPLTDFVDYTDFNTGEKKHGKIGIADAGNDIQSENEIYFG